MALTPEGFSRPRLLEIKTNLDASVRSALGAVNTNADSVVGQITGILSEALDNCYEVLQQTYDSMYPASAEGTSLDGAVSFVGMERIPSSPTTVVAMCYGTDSTLVPQDALARSIDSKIYLASADTVISTSSCGDITIEPLVIQSSANYQIILNGVSYVYFSSSSASSDEIASGLFSLIDKTKYLCSLDGSKLRIRDVDQYSDFVFSSDSKIGIKKLGTPVLFVCSENGAHSLPVGGLNIIDSALAGWDEIFNLVEGKTGRDTEKDDELRLRHANEGVRVAGSATNKAIRARIIAGVPSVSYCSVYENRTNLINEQGLPPHSIECVVDGGDDQAVADKLFEVKPSGIETYGSTALEVLDENGDVQICKFSRPSTKFIWIRVSVNSLYTEEALTSEVQKAIINAVIEYSKTIGIGEDIITQRFYGPIYNATTGIGSLSVEAAITDLETGSPAYSTNNISIPRGGMGEFSEFRILVLGAVI